ncbi:MAG: type II secretion system protein [Pseudohongiellaceae bacterium]
MKNRKQSRGFSLVELVATLVLIGIISAVVVPRFVGSTSFNPIIVRDQLIAMARSAQQNALGRADVVMTVTPNPTGTEVTLTVSDGGGVIDEATAPLNDVSLSGDINITASCAATPGADAISNANPLTIAFGELGDLAVSGVTGSTGAVLSALRICINNTAVYSVCVSPSGFAYAGDCDA